MKLHLPKALVAALVAALTTQVASAEATAANINWDPSSSGYWKWDSALNGWVRGTLQDGHAKYEWIDGYSWATTVTPTSSINSAQAGTHGPVFVYDNVTIDTSSSTNKNTSDGGGIVAINGAQVTATLGTWGGYIFVDETSSLTAKGAVTSGGLKNMSNNSSGYNVIANGALKFANEIRFDGGGQDHKWYVGKNGSLTSDYNINNNGKNLTLTVEVLGGDLNGATVANRTMSHTSVSLSQINLSGTSWLTLNLIDAATGQTITDNSAYLSADGHSITTYANETLVWNGGNGTWTSGAVGWHLQSDTSSTPTDTGFINFDSVIINTADTITLGGNITFTNLTANAAATVSAGSNTLSGGTLTATSGQLTVQGGNTHFNRLTTEGTGTIKLQNGYSAGTAADGDVLTIDGNVNLGDGNTLGARHGATINIEGGTVTTTRLISHNANDYGRNDTINIKGGVVNVTKVNALTDTAVSSGIIIGHWHTTSIGDSNASHAINVEGGILNGAEAALLVSWDSRAYLRVNSGEVNVKKLIIGGQANALAAKVYLNGGRLDVGDGGITTVQTSVSERLVISGGTIGTLTTSEISTASPISITTSGSFSIDTEVHSVNEAGFSNATGNAGSITVNGAISGDGAMTKTGVGTLKLSGDNSSYSGAVTVSGGTLIANHANALGSGKVTVESNGTLEFAVDGTLKSTDGYTGTVQLNSGVSALLSGAVTVGALTLGGDASIALDITGDNTLGVTTLNANSHTLTFNFEEYVGALTNGTYTFATGLGSTEVNLTYGSATLTHTDNTWTTTVGRTSLGWTLADGALSLTIGADGAKDLTWKGGDGTWDNTVGDAWQYNSSDIVFQDGDSITFGSGTGTVTLGAEIAANSMRVENGTSMTVTGEHSVTATSLVLGSAAEGEGTVALTLDGAALTATNLTAEAGKTATLTLSNNATLTVNEDITVGNGATFTLISNEQTVSADAITVNQGGTATINGNVTGADDGLSTLTTGNGSESANGGSLTINGGVTGTDLAITAGSKGSISITGAVTGVSSITAGDNASVSLTGNVSGFTSLTAGTNGTIELGGNTIAGGNGVTINGNATIGLSTSTFTHTGGLTIESGTTTLNAKRTVDGDVTIKSGATLDITAGNLWTNVGYVGKGNISLYGTLITKDFAYNDGSWGHFHHNANNFMMYNGAEMIVTGERAAMTRGLELSGDAGSGGLYTLTFRDSVKSATMTFAGGFSLGTNNASRSDVVLCFNTEGDSDITLAPRNTTAGSGANDKGFSNSSLTVRKTGTGTLTLKENTETEGQTSYSGYNFAANIDVDAGTFAFGEGGNTTGSIDVANGAVLKYSGGDHGLSNATFAAGGSLYVAAGTVTLQDELSITRFNKTKNIYFGTGTDERKIAFDSNGSLKYDGVTFRAKTGLDTGTVASITGGYVTENGQNLDELSLWNASQTYSNLAIEMATGTDERLIQATLDNVDLTLKGSKAKVEAAKTLANLTLESNDATASTFTSTAGDLTLESATIENGSTLKKGSSYTIAANAAEGTMAGVTLSDSKIGGTTSTPEDGGDTLQTLGEMTSLTLTFAAENTAAEISDLTMRDVRMIDGAVSLGDNVTAVVSYDTTAAQASPASLSGIAMLGDAGSEPQTVTATTVKTGGSIDGTLTVDIDASLLYPAGATLKWTILDGVTITEGKDFTLQFGSVLQYLLNRRHEMTLKWGADAENLTSSATVTATNLNNITTATGGLIAGFTGGSLVLTVDNIPEPTTGTLAVLALAALAARRRRK